MDYQSTRNKNISVTSAQAVKQGISSEGGLFVPSDIPPVTPDELYHIYNAMPGYPLSK